MEEETLRGNAGGRARIHFQSSLRPAEDLAGFVGRTQAFEDAEACVDSVVEIGDEDVAEYGCERR